MKNVLIVHHSKTGTTEAFANELSAFAENQNYNAKTISINDCDIKDIAEADKILLGCWTSGLFIFAQKPETQWVNFAKNLPALKNKDIGLFTTYKLRTGSMFRKMEQKLSDKIDQIDTKLQSKKAELNDELRKQLVDFLSN